MGYRGIDVTRDVNRWLAGVLTGAIVFNLFAVVPYYRRLSPAEFIASHSSLSFFADTFMPILGVGVVWSGVRRGKVERSAGVWFGTMAMALLAVVSTAVNVPINLRCQGLLGGPPANSAGIIAMRDRWASAHVARTVLACLGLSLLIRYPRPQEVEHGTSGNIHRN